MSLQYLYPPKKEKKENNFATCEINLKYKKKQPAAAATQISNKDKWTERERQWLEIEKGRVWQSVSGGSGRGGQGGEEEAAAAFTGHFHA